MIKHSYMGFWRSFGVCGVEVFQGESGGIVVVLTELADNPGTSVTNMVERLATDLVRGMLEIGLVDDPHAVRWIEHYQAPPQDAPGKADALNRESWDEVLLTWDDGQYHSPRWRPSNGDRYQRPDFGKQL